MQRFELGADFGKRAKGLRFVEVPCERDFVTDELPR